MNGGKDKTKLRSALIKNDSLERRALREKKSEADSCLN